MVLLYQLGDYVPKRYPKYPPELGCEVFQPILATATYPRTGRPNAKGRAKYIPHCPAAGSAKHIGLS